MTAGGPAAGFDVTLTNPTPSAYENVTDTLITSRYASVQVLRSGTWQTLTPSTSDTAPDVYGFDVIGKDASLSAHGSTVAKVRVTYRKDTPAGKTPVHPCVYVNQGSAPFRGTTFCASGSTLTVLAADSGGSTGGTPIPSSTGSGIPTASVTATASATPTASASPSSSASPSAVAPSSTSGTTSGTSGGGSLAHTGSGGTSVIAAAAGALLLAGTGVLGAVGPRRRRTRA